MTRLKLAASDTFRSLRTRNFRLFFIGQIVSQSGTWMEMVAVIWLVLRLTDSGIALGLVTAAEFLPLLLLGPWAGVLADRVDRHRLMLTTQVTFGAFAAALAVLVVFDAYNLWVLYFFSVVFGLITAIDNPNRRALVNDLVAREDLPNAVGLNSTLMTGSRVVGPALAGALIAGPGVEWCFIVNAFSYIAVIAALWRMDRSALRRPPRVAKAKGQMREGFAYVRRSPELLLPLVLVAVVGTFAFNYQVTLPLLAERTLDGDASTFTLFYSAMSLGSVFGALKVARSKDITIMTLLRAGGGLAVTTTILAVAPTIPLATLATLGVGFYVVSVISGGNAVVQLRADPAMRGRVLALFGMVFLGAKPIGGPVVGWVAETIDVRASLLLGAAASAAVSMVILRRLQHLPPAVRARTLASERDNHWDADDDRGASVPGPVEELPASTGPRSPAPAAVPASAR